MIFVLDHITRITGVASFLEKGWETGNAWRSYVATDLEVDLFALDATPFSKVSVFFN